MHFAEIVYQPLFTILSPVNGPSQYWSIISSASLCCGGSTRLVYLIVISPSPELTTLGGSGGLSTVTLSASQVISFAHPAKTNSATTSALGIKVVMKEIFLLTSQILAVEILSRLSGELFTKNQNNPHQTNETAASNHHQ